MDAPLSISHRPSPGIPWDDPGFQQKGQGQW